MAEIDQALAHHCIQDLGSVNTPPCAIIQDRSVCAGNGILDELFEFTVQAMLEASTAKKKKKWMLWGQIDALAYACAKIINPYRPDTEAVKDDANREAAARQDGASSTGE